MMRLRFLALAILPYSVIPAPASAITLAGSASYSFSDSTSDRDGCEIALTRVRKQVLEQACGTFLTGGAARFRTEETDEMNMFSFESVGGRVLDTRVVGKNVSRVDTGPVSHDGLKRCTVTASVEVRCDQGRRDPGFAPSFASDVRLNEAVFREDEALKITVAAASDMQITVFQYLPGESGPDNVQLVFPNLLQRGSFVAKGEELTVPDSDTARGYRLAMRLPPGKDRGVEELMVVATKKKVAFPLKMSLGEFHRILAEIPLDDRREAIFPYLIVRKEALFR